MADVLIDGATIITVDGQRRVLENGAVAVEDGRIVAVGPANEVRAAHRAETVLDGTDRVVMPGLVDLYAHAGGAMMKCLGEQLDGAVWRDLLDDIAFRYATPRWWYVESQLQAAERLLNGCTMMLSQPGVSTPRMDDPAYVWENQRAYEDLGIRARIIIGPARPPWPQTYADYVDGRRVEKSVSLEQVFDSCDRVFAESRDNPSALVDYCTGASRFGNQNPMDPMWKPEHEQFARAQAEGLRALMDKYDVGYWCHAYGNAIEWAYDQGLGLLGSKTILSHVSGVSERTIGILAETDTRVNHNPRARRLYLYQEPCPVVEL
ncbi:MAG: hypothetical protein IT307_14165, partial [Chloroflexi bacterium]|nr:hypothetical protein [Chloroflexota bacterium]